MQKTGWGYGLRMEKSGDHRYARKDMPSGSLELNHISDLLIADVIVPPAINTRKSSLRSDLLGVYNFINYILLKNT